MYSLLFLAALGASAPAAVAHKPSAAILPAAAEKDAKCLTLSILGASTAKDDPDKMKTALAESWYFLGKMDSGAPGQDLSSLLNRMAEELRHDPRVKELGSDCDAQFAGRAADLHNVGSQPEKARP